MNLSSTKFVQASLFGLVLCACAHKPNKDLQAEKIERQNDEAELAEKQADLNQEQAEDRAELERKQREDQAELQREKAETRAEGDKEVHQAHDEMVEERRTEVAKQQERIKEAQAKADELKTKSNGLSADKKRRFDEAWRVYQSKSDVATNQVRAGQAVSNAEWANTKSETEKAIDDLEESVNELKKISMGLSK